MTLPSILSTHLEGRFSRSIIVEGGSDNKATSEFNGPVIFNEKVTSLSTKGVEMDSLFLQGGATVSRKYTVGISTPTQQVTLAILSSRQDPLRVVTLVGFIQLIMIGIASVQSVFHCLIKVWLVSMMVLVLEPHHQTQQVEQRQNFWLDLVPLSSLLMILVLVLEPPQMSTNSTSLVTRMLWDMSQHLTS